MNGVKIGIRRIEYYVPQGIRDSKYIAGASGIDETVIREKFGIKQVYKAGKDESVSDLGVRAANKLLSLECISALEIDMIVYCGSEYKDYYLFNCAAKMQDDLGAKNAVSFEIHNLCSAGVWSLKVLKSMMITDESLKKVLLISSSKESDLINYKDPDSRFMFNFGDGAAAVLLERNYEKNIILESAMITDGRFADAVSVPGLGASAAEGDANCLKVKDIKKMRAELDPITLDNFSAVIRQAVIKSGYNTSDINFVAPLFMKRSILLSMLERFKLSEQNTYLLEDFGHCQSADCFIALKKGEAAGRLRPDMLSVLVSAGTGYTWAASVVRWG